MTLSKKLQDAFPGVDFNPITGNASLRDDGDGPYIDQWDEAKLGPKPTKKAVDAIAATPDPVVVDISGTQDSGTVSAELTARQKLDAMLAQFGLTVAELKAELDKEAANDGTLVS